MKHIYLTLVALCALCAGTYAQNTWFCGEAGTKLDYIRKDSKGVVEGGSYQYVIKDKAEAGGRTTITFDVVMPGGITAPGCQVWTEGGLFHTDINASLGQFGEGMTAKGNAPLLPENPEIGADLGNCSVSIDALMLTSEYTKVRFTRHEKISVAAGEFDCWCLEYDTTDKVMGLKAQNHTEQWIAKGVGDVKVVTKDKKGRVVSEKELVKLSK